MDNLTYFNIGFRAENTKKALTDLKNNNFYNKILFEDAYELVGLCKKAWKADFGKNKEDSEKIRAFRKVLFEDINLLGESKIEDIERFYGKKAIIDQTESMIKNILDNKKNSPDQLELGIFLFDNLAEKCYKLSAPIPSCW